MFITVILLLAIVCGGFFFFYKSYINSDNSDADNDTEAEYQSASSESVLANFISVIAYIEFIAGIILALVMFVNADDYTYGFSVMGGFITLFSSVVGFAILLGLAKCVRAAHKYLNED